MWTSCNFHKCLLFRMHRVLNKWWFVARGTRVALMDKPRTQTEYIRPKEVEVDNKESSPIPLSICKVPSLFHALYILTHPKRVVTRQHWRQTHGQNILGDLVCVWPLDVTHDNPVLILLRSWNFTSKSIGNRKTTLPILTRISEEIPSRSTRIVDPKKNLIEYTKSTTVICNSSHFNHLKKFSQLDLLVNCLGVYTAHIQANGSLWFSIRPKRRKQRNDIVHYNTINWQFEIEYQQLYSTS